uniref:Uncharacterized protein n=1 Tax=Aegilops tauschii TaxID=37682 RepID=M8BLZ3_AEGTA
MVAVAPKPPAKHLRDDDDDDDDDEDEEELKFKIPQTTTWWKRRIFIFLREKLRLPDILLMALFSVTMKAWIIITLWFLLAPIARKYEVGPLYILATGFLIILLNLGRRQQGDVSAYSIFNEDFREIPGTFNAERIDRDLRAGQLYLSVQIQKSRVTHRYAGFVADETSTVKLPGKWQVQLL